MRRKAVFEVDEKGSVFGKNDMVIGGLNNGAYEPFEYVDEKEPFSVKELLSLKDAGYEAKEIIEMRSKGII